MNNLQRIKRVMNCPNKRGKLVLTSIALRHAIDSLQDFNPMIEKIHDKVEAIFENIATQLPGDKENNTTFLKDYESLVDFSTPKLEQELRDKYLELLRQPMKCPDIFLSSKNVIEFNHQPCKNGCNCAEVEQSNFVDGIKSFPCLEHQKEMPVWSSEKSEGFGPSPLEGLLKEFFNKSEIIIKKKDGR